VPRKLFQTTVRIAWRSIVATLAIGALTFLGLTQSSSPSALVAARLVVSKSRILAEQVSN
jgi:hypothetical protein